MSDEYTAVIMIAYYARMHIGLAPSERREYGVFAEVDGGPMNPETKA